MLEGIGRDTAAALAKYFVVFFPDAELEQHSAAAENRFWINVFVFPLGGEDP